MISASLSGEMFLSFVPLYLLSSVLLATPGVNKADSLPPLLPTGNLQINVQFETNERCAPTFSDNLVPEAIEKAERTAIEVVKDYPPIIDNLFKLKKPWPASFSGNVRIQFCESQSDEVQNRLSSSFREFDAYEESFWYGEVSISNLKQWDLVLVILLDRIVFSDLPTETGKEIPIGLDLHRLIVLMARNFYSSIPFDLEQIAKNPDPRMYRSCNPHDHNRELRASYEGGRFIDRIKKYIPTSSLEQNEKDYHLENYERIRKIEEQRRRMILKISTKW